MQNIVLAEQEAAWVVSTATGGPRTCSDDPDTH